MNAASAADLSSDQLQATNMNDVPLCVFCRMQPADPLWRPFCSERCKLQDLARWVDGAYCVPAEPTSEPEAPDEAED